MEYKKSSYVIMEANKKYWRGAPHVDQLIFQCYTNEDTLAQDLKAGTLDGAIQLLNSQIQLFKDDPNVTVESIRVNGYDDVVFNCYVPPAGVKSLGNPALQDAKFRQALQYAVDREKIVSIVYYGNARPADTHHHGRATTPTPTGTGPRRPTRPTPTTSPRPTPRSPPPATRSRTACAWTSRASRVTLRLWSRQSSATSQQEGKMLAGSLRELGIKVDYEVMDNGALMDKLYNMKGDQFLPDFDLCIWGWYNSIDPGQATSYFTTDQIGGWSDSAYSNPEYDQLYIDQLHTIDPVERKAILDQMQQIIYEDSPYLLLTYSNDTEGWNTAKWEGWVKSPAGFGNVLNQTVGVFTYLEVRPKVGRVGRRRPTDGGGSSTTTWIIVGVVAAASSSSRSSCCSRGAGAGARRGVTAAQRSESGRHRGGGRCRARRPGPSPRSGRAHQPLAQVQRMGQVVARAHPLEQCRWPRRAWPHSSPRRGRRPPVPRRAPRGRGRARSRRPPRRPAARSRRDAPAPRPPRHRAGPRAPAGRAPAPR